MVQVSNSVEMEQRESAREDAFARLVALLERDNPHPRQPSQEKVNPLSMLARLQAAHAAYSLANTTEMERAGTGAYFRHRQVPE